ncbi:MAG: acylphosphatase [Planctomycetota bacterium]|nr:acylphosphatase [Planctomycetota bacterium]
MAESRAHVYITGRVQGVCFRAYTQEEAAQRGVTGWVRNLADGRVEAVFEGTQAAVKGMVEWCNRGPSHAHVTDVRVEWEPPSDEFRGFRIAY